MGIMPSTLRKLQEKDSKVNRLIWPAHSFELNGERVETQESREYFATDRGLNERVLQVAELITAGRMPKYHADYIPARALCQITCTELSPTPFKRGQLA